MTEIVRKLFGNMKINLKKDIVFICSIADGILQVIKYQRGSKRFLGVGFKKIFFNDSVVGEEAKVEGLNEVFNKLGYQGNPIILSLPRAQATCRYLKIPSSIPEEIERIAHLQAPRYLPYQEQELVTGYEQVLTDKDGFSQINLVIVHRDLIERYLKIFTQLKPAKITIIMSSYGACNLCNYLRIDDLTAVMVVTGALEMTIIRNGKLVFSRSVKIDQFDPGWENIFVSEINKSRDAYMKDIPDWPLGKIVFLIEDISSRKTLENIKKNLDLPVQLFLYTEKINLSSELLKSISQIGFSFACLFGLGLTVLPESLNLLSAEIKEKNKFEFARKEKLKLVLFFLGIILVTGLGMMKNINNKVVYLEKLKIELNKISQAAKPLEEKDKKLRILEGRAQKGPVVLDILSELHRISPDRVFLVNFVYEEDNQVVLHGQAPELNSVFVFAAELEKSAVFKRFSIKVRYATKKKTRDGEVIDFEITCSKK